MPWRPGNQEDCAAAAHVAGWEGSSAGGVVAAEVAVAEEVRVVGRTEEAAS